MTISSEDRIAGPFNGNGSQTAFPFAFKVFGKTDLQVIRADADDIEHELVLDSDFSVTMNLSQDSNPGGTVTYPVTGSALPTGESLTITTQLPFEQPTDITNAGGFYPQVIEDALDRDVMLVQQLAVLVARCLRLGVSVPAGVDVTLPRPEPGGVIAWTANGLGLTNLAPDTTVSTAQLRADLADLTMSTKAGGLVGHLWNMTYLANTLGAKARETVSAYADFGIIGNGTTDVSVRLLDALADLKAAGYQGEFLLLDRDYKLSETIVMPVGITGVGSGGGKRDDPTQAAATKFSWYGGAAEMFKFGYQAGAVVVGGGMRGVRLDGRGIATKTIALKDLQRARFENLNLVGAVASAVYMTNSNGVPPTRGMTFDDVFIQLRGGATQSAHGIHIDGVTGGVDGVTLSTMIRVTIEHANGDGVRIGQAGDAFTWIDLQTFRADVEAGVGVHASSTDPAQIVGNHTFMGGVVSGGFRIVTPGAARGWLVMNGSSDTNAGINPIVFGAGAYDVRVINSVNGRENGAVRIGNVRDVAHHDSMMFRRWDSANDTLHNVAGNYLTGGNYTGASIADAGQPAGAVRLSTSAVSGEVIYFTDSPNIGAVGLVPGYHPILHLIWAPLSTSNFKARIGLIGDLSDTPINGIYIEADPATDTHYRVVCRSGGFESAFVVSDLGTIGAAKIQWLIDVTQDFVTFRYRTSGNEDFGIAATFTTNIPTTPLSRLAWIKTTSAAQHSIDIYEWKLAFESEV